MMRLKIHFTLGKCTVCSLIVNMDGSKMTVTDPKNRAFMLPQLCREEIARQQPKHNSTINNVNFILFSNLQRNYIKCLDSVGNSFLY